MAYVGRVMVWVRKEDRPIWDSINDTAEWLHECLQRRKELQTRTVKLPQFEEPIYIQSKDSTCPNGHIMGTGDYCLNEECEYGH